jgi:hypothetical protein
MTDPREITAIGLANQARQRCICLEEGGVTACACPAPVTRDQVGRLRAYGALHPERAVIYSEVAGAWLAALHAFFPESDDPVLSWLLDPFTLPAEADLRHAGSLDALLDLLGAPPVSVMSADIAVRGADGQVCSKPVMADLRLYPPGADR